MVLHCGSHLESPSNDLKTLTASFVQHTGLAPTTLRVARSQVLGKRNLQHGVKALNYCEVDGRLMRGSHGGGTIDKRLDHMSQGGRAAAVVI